MSARHRLRAVLTLAYLNGIIPIRVQPLYVASLIASPLAFLFFITIASKGDLYANSIAGGLVLTVLSIGTSLQTDISHYKQDLKLQDVLVASPVEAPVYVAGLAVSELLYATPGIGLFVLLWILTGTVTWIGALTMMGVLLLVWAFGSALGFTIATYFSDVRETFAIAPLISLGLTTIPPVYYPFSLLYDHIGNWAYLVFLSPTTYAGQLAQAAFALPGAALTPVQALIDWLVLIGVTAGLFLLASRKARWRDP